MAEKADTNSDLVIIKKYANRRLYNTRSSSYITLDDLAVMVREDVDFQVLDAKTGNDITHSILTQIIMEEEANGEHMLPVSFLRQLIGMYGNSMQSMMPPYLEAAMVNFEENQAKLQEAFKSSMGTNALTRLAETNMAMFQAATKAFMPGAGEAQSPSAAAAPANESGRDDIEFAAIAIGRNAAQARSDRRLGRSSPFKAVELSIAPSRHGAVPASLENSVQFPSRGSSCMSAIRHALSIKREDDFAQWYQEVISAADMAEESGVRGCMVIKPWGYGIWERMQRLLDDRIKQAGVQNAYFPIFIPLANFEREAAHVEGFAKEMAVVTHHRLISDGEGGLVPDPEAKLEEPLVVRPTSETIIGDAMSRWVQSWRDLPLKLNQWANVVRWEMRTRMFLRTSEFLWQEGHTAHATAEEAKAETMRALEMYRAFAEEDVALPVIAGEKPENERFPGARETWSIEAMMQDGKALQAGTSHYLGTNFAEAANIRYQDREGGQELCHTVSWGMSTRMVGGLIMTHGDDDGLRVPPALAPFQVVILPMLRDKPEDAALLEYCENLRAGLVGHTALGEPLRVLLDTRPGKAAAKRWDWVRKGAPVIIEVGGRDMENGVVSLLRRDALWDANSGKPAFESPTREIAAQTIPSILEDMQSGLFTEARERRDANITRDITDLAGLKAFYGEDRHQPGWAEVQWSKPTGEGLEAVIAQLKALKLTFRNVPLNTPPADGVCIFTGEQAAERIYVARAY